MSPTLDEEFFQNKAQILDQAAVIKLNGHFYLESHLRPCFEDSPRLELRKLIAADLTELNEVTDWHTAVVREVPSEEMMAYDSSQESIQEAIQEQNKDGVHRKKADPNYKKLMKRLKPFQNIPLVVPIPKQLFTPVLSVAKATQSVHYEQKSNESFKQCHSGPRGLVRVFKPCAIQVKKSILKIDNVEIYKRCNPQGDLVCRNTIKISRVKDKSLKKSQAVERNFPEESQQCQQESIQSALKPKICDNPDPAVSAWLAELGQYNAFDNKCSIGVPIELHKTTKNVFQETDSTLVKNKRLDIPPELHGVYNLYKNSRKPPQTIKEESEVDILTAREYELSSTNYETQIRRSDAKLPSTVKVVRKTPRSEITEESIDGKLKKIIVVSSTVKSSTVFPKSSSGHSKSSIKMFFCKQCQKFKKAYESSSVDLQRVSNEQKLFVEKSVSASTISYRNIVNTKPHGRRLKKHLSSNPSMDYFYRNIVQSLRKMSKKLSTV